MSIERHRCFVPACDACRADLHDVDEGYIPHFDTEDAALTHALDSGWRIDTDGHIYCDRCLDIATW